MLRVIHFEISANAPEKVAAFYKNVFGWKITKWEGPQEYWLVNTGESGNGINGGIFRPREEFTATVNTIDVPDIDDYIEKVKRNGGQVVTEKMSIPDVGTMAYCKDVEGTLFGIIQPVPHSA